MKASGNTKHATDPPTCMPSCEHRLSDTHKCKQIEMCMHTVLDSPQGGGESWTFRKDARPAFARPGSALGG
eukprot:4081431-Alexandrium_andersonii.AAC.1